MAKAPSNPYARARAAYVMGRIAASQFAECLAGRAWVSGQFLLRFGLNRHGMPCTEMHRLDPIGTHKKEAKHG